LELCSISLTRSGDTTFPSWLMKSSKLQLNVVAGASDSLGWSVFSASSMHSVMDRSTQSIKEKMSLAPARGQLSVSECFRVGGSRLLRL
jgi:hypothetical protein